MLFVHIFVCDLHLFFVFRYIFIYFLNNIANRVETNCKREIRDQHPNYQYRCLYNICGGDVPVPYGGHRRHGEVEAPDVPLCPGGLLVLLIIKLFLLFKNIIKINKIPPTPYPEASSRWSTLHGSSTPPQVARSARICER